MGRALCFRSSCATLCCQKFFYLLPPSFISQPSEFEFWTTDSCKKGVFVVQNTGKTSLDRLKNIIDVFISIILLYYGFNFVLGYLMTFLFVLILICSDNEFCSMFMNSVMQEVQTSLKIDTCTMASGRPAVILERASLTAKVFCIRTSSVGSKVP